MTEFVVPLEKFQEVRASYSADRIGDGRSIKEPFRYQGAFMVCVGTLGKGFDFEYAAAYELVHPTLFDGNPQVYAMQRMRDDGEAARRNPLGFYHGTLVKCGPLEFVMQGPEVRFLPGEIEQAALF
jgi:hypothetical protein